MTEVVMVRTADVSGISEAPWNVNVVEPEKYSQLKGEMARNGPGACDPIDTCVIGGKKFTCDGAHRLRAAKELGWDTIQEIFHPEITTEQDARLFNFKRDYARGEIDPFRLGRSFEWFHEQGMKQEEIAKKFGLDVSTVSRRMSLLKLEPEAVEASRDKGLAVSHLEILAAVPAQVQARIIKRLPKGREVTVESLSWACNDAKRAYKEEVLVKAWLSDKRAKFPKCPKCGEVPASRGYSEYVNGTKIPMAVRCSNHHEWSLVSGVPESRVQRSTDSPAKLPQHIKCNVPIENFAASAANLASEVLKGYDSLESVEFVGKVKGKDVALRLGIYDFGVYLEYGAPGTRGGIYRLTVKKNETKNTEFATYVTGPQIEDRRDLIKLQATVEGFLEKYCNLPHGKLAKRGRGRPRKEAAK